MSASEEKTATAAREQGKDVKLNLDTLAASLKHVFGEIISVEARPAEIQITIGDKIAWINEYGELTGAASGPRSTVLSVGVDVDCTRITASGTAIVS
jgi:plastocyanin